MLHVDISQKILRLRKWLVHFLIIPCAIFVCAYHVFAAGTLDPSFGINGEANGVGVAFALQPDGKIVSVGYVGGPPEWDFAVMRYYSNGRPDITFGRKGRVITPVTPFADFPTSLAIQPDGKIVVGGYSPIGLVLVRYNPNGSLDYPFGNGGIVITNRTGNDVIKAIAFQPDGKIVVVGSGASLAAPCYTPYLVGRYTHSGALDYSFGRDGIVLSGFSGGIFNPLCTPAYYASYTSVTVTESGKIIVGGSAYGFLEGRFVLGQFSTNGYLDYLVTYRDGRDDGNGGGFRFVQELPDGKVLAIGRKVARFENGGQLDPTFPPNTQLGTNSNSIWSGHGALFEDGRIAHAQSYSSGNVEAIYTRILSAEGKTLGLATIPNLSYTIRGVLAQPDGKVIVISDKMRRYVSISD